MHELAEQAMMSIRKQMEFEIRYQSLARSAVQYQYNNNDHNKIVKIGKG